MIALRDIGISIRSPNEPVASLSGGERQSIAIARAVYFGARVLILDEPTAALGVREAAKVQTYIINARARGLGVILITHNLHHAEPVADRYVLPRAGRNSGEFHRGDIGRADLADMIAQVGPG